MKLICAEQLEAEIVKLSCKLDSATASDAEIDQGLTLIGEVHAYLNDKYNYKCSSCVAVIGSSGVGKSTIVSLLFGDLLVHHEDDYTRVLVAAEPLPEATIQYGSLSKTLLPGVSQKIHDGKSMMVVDMPGTHDTRGPFAELVVHFIKQWLFAKFKNLQFLLVATPPQERAQEILLANTINRVCASGSKAVLVITKCDPDFNPKSIANKKAIFPEYRNIPVFVLPKPMKSDAEGFNLSMLHAEMKSCLLREISSSLSTVETNALAEILPESSQILLRNFCNRSIAIARNALSEVFLIACDKQKKAQYSISTASKLLDIFENADFLTFEAFVEQIKLLLGSAWVGSTDKYSAVQRAVERLKLIATWSDGEIVRSRDEWLSTRCRSKLECIKRELIGLKSSVHRYYDFQRIRDKRTIVLSGWNLQLEKGSQILSSIEDFVKASHATALADDIPTVILIGFKSVTINVHIRAWANLVVVTPQIGAKHVDLSAEDPVPPHVPLRAAPGQDGVHGTPGLPGGNLIVICDKIIGGRFAKRSNGQRGGNGQNGGDAITTTEINYQILRFKSDVESFMKPLQSLSDWESASSKLPLDLELIKQSKSQLPPDAGHLLLTATGSAIAATGIAVSGCLPLLAPIVAPTMIPAGTGMIGKGLQRNTQATLELERLIVRSEGNSLPGRGGNGGCGGRFYVVEAGHAIQGPSGENGQPGSAGEHSSTLMLQGTVTQEYGIFGRSQGPASIKIKDKWVGAADVSRFSARVRQPPVVNSLMPLDTVNAYFNDSLAKMKESFPLCDFCDVKMPLHAKKYLHNAVVY